MAALTMTRNPQKFTLPTSGAHTIDLDNFIPEYSDNYEVMLKLISGTTVAVSADGSATTADSSDLSSSNDRMILDVKNGRLLHVNAGAGSELIHINVLSKD